MLSKKMIHAIALFLLIVFISWTFSPLYSILLYPLMAVFGLFWLLNKGYEKIEACNYKMANLLHAIFINTVMMKCFAENDYSIFFVLMVFNVAHIIEILWRHPEISQTHTATKEETIKLLENKNSV